VAKTTRKKGKSKKGTKYRKEIKLPTKLTWLMYLGDTQGCGTIRCIYPALLLNHFKMNGVSCNTECLNHFVNDVNFYKEISFVQFQRSATEHHLNIFKHFKNMIQKIPNKAPLIYEIDDLLIGIPEWNFAHEYYVHNEKYVKEMMKIADGVTCSTQPLADIYSEFNKNVVVIPNHLPKFIWGDIYPKHNYYDEKHKSRIFWGGSQNHFALKKMVDEGLTGGDFGKELMNFIRKTTDKYEWVFMGAMPEELKNLSKNKIKFVPWAPVFNYPQTMKAIEPDICIAPLDKGVFNDCKSNIKSLEFTACGAPGVYSNVYPYKDMNLKSDNDEEMISHIEKLAGDIDYRAKIYRKDSRSVSGQLFWEESGNLKHYINSYLGLFGSKLPTKMRKRKN